MSRLTFTPWEAAMGSFRRTQGPKPPAPARDIEPTSTGPRLKGGNKFQKREAQELLEWRKEKANKADRFFVRNLKTSPPGSWQRDHEVGTPVRIAKLVNGELWLRHDHRSPVDDNPKLWNRLSEASKKRLFHEQKQVGIFHAKGELSDQDASDLLGYLDLAMLEALETE